jgi:hypothetical protein
MSDVRVERCVYPERCEGFFVACPAPGCGFDYRVAGEAQADGPTTLLACPRCGNKVELWVLDTAPDPLLAEETDRIRRRVKERIGLAP